MTEINHLWDTQKDFQKYFYKPEDLTLEEKIAWTKEFCLCAHQELAEVLQSVDWKSYHLYDKEYSTEHLKEEIVDVVKFVVNLCIVWGVSPEEFVTIFDIKSEKVKARYIEKNITK